MIQKHSELGYNNIEFVTNRYSHMGRELFTLINIVLLVNDVLSEKWDLSMNSFRR